MVNDTNTLNGALMELGETLAYNLSNMGVNANANNGLTTLAEKILDINNFQNGLFIKINDNITQTGDTLWIIAIPLNNNKLLSEKYETVDFYLNENTLISSVSTNDWGIASTTLTGAGLGKCTIHAEYNNEKSEQISLVDCIYYFINSYNSYKSSGITVTPNANSVTFSTGENYGLVFLSDNNTFVEGCFAFEFKIVSFSNGSNINIRCGSATSSSLQRSLSQIGATIGDVVRVENGNGIVHFYINDVLSPATRGNSGTIKYGFNILANESITVTDMKLYPLFDDVVTNINITGVDTVESGNTATLTLKPIGENGYPVRNVDIDLYQDNILVNTLNTGNTGKATYTYNATGIGKVEFVAKYNTIQSETYEIIDCSIYDEGTIASHNDIWSTSNYGTITRQSEYSVASRTQTTNNASFPMTFGDNDTTIIIFDYMKVDGGNSDGIVVIRQGSSTNVSILDNSNLGGVIGEWNTVKITIDNTTPQITVNNLTTGHTFTNTMSNAGNSFRWALYGGTTEIRFKKFRVYSSAWITDWKTYSVTGTSTNDTTYSIDCDDIGVDLSTTDFVLEWDMKTSSNGVRFILGAKNEWSVTPINSNYCVFIGCDSSGYNSYGIRTTSTTSSRSGTFSLNTLHHCKIVKENHTLSYYVDNTLLGTQTENWFTNYNDWSFYLLQWNTGTTIIQNIILKPL